MRSFVNIYLFLIIMSKDIYLSSRKASEILGIHPNTLRSWESKNLIEAIKTPSGQRLYNTNSYIQNQKKIEFKIKKNYIYTRVSSSNQKDDLKTQTNLLKLKFPNHNAISDIGSGLNYKRKGFQTILESCLSGDIGQVVVTHKDRLCRFGFEMVEYLVNSAGGEIVVLNDIKSSPQEEMVKDITSIIHVFSSRLYGLRKYKTQIKDELQKRDEN
jgi:predicted site-specific integrase-resolvase